MVMLTMQAFSALLAAMDTALFIIVLASPPGALVESPPSADVVGSSIIGQTMDYVHGRAATDTAPSACSSGSTGPGAVWCLPSGMTFAHHPIFHSQPQCMDLCNPRVNPG